VARTDGHDGLEMVHGVVAAKVTGRGVRGHAQPRRGIKYYAPCKDAAGVSFGVLHVEAGGVLCVARCV
jgi:hypothetical protein